MGKKKESYRWANWLLKLFWVTVAILVVSVIAQYVSTRPATYAENLNSISNGIDNVGNITAGLPGGAASDNTTSNTAGNTAGGNAVNNATGGSASGLLTGLTFNEYFCREIAIPAETIIVALAIFMILAAGVVYILSLGQAGGDKSVGGVSTAKSMIVAAVTGLALYLMSRFLLGDCMSTTGLGGWIGSFFQ